MYGNYSFMQFHPCVEMEIHCTLYQMEPSANECISVDEQSGFLQEKSSPPSQQIADESMEKTQANVAKPIQLDTHMELEQSGSSQSQIVLGLPSLQETGDTQMEFEHSSSSQIILGLPSAQKTGETIKVSDVNDSKSPCNPIQQEAENEIDSKEEEQDKMKLNDTTTTEEQDEPYFLTDKPYFHCILGKTQLHNMGIPKSVNQLLPEKEVPVNLSYRNKTWKVKYQGNRASKKFDSSWKHFVHDNNLRFGDGCVFELTEHSDNCITFRIQILDGDIPSELLDRVEGQTIEHPITIG
ncbi:hypothetical protein MKW98_005609 [Papaver atlanticum]|uniref:TF-B3 domain-containing protein n=1 Tax=Papaver atlanticum TaxID=357466 RepID=A0AAD4SS24_9MAGN|nr:hypothetical protein MKW98_005609 [Papaver atlanticum]